MYWYFKLQTSDDERSSRSLSSEVDHMNMADNEDDEEEENKDIEVDQLKLGNLLKRRKVG